MKTKKKYIIIVAVCGIVASAIAISAYNSNQSFEKRVEYAWSHRSYNYVFNENEECFQAVADYLLSNGELIGAEKDVIIGIDNHKAYMYSFSMDRNIDLDVEMENNLRRVYDAFGDLECTSIQVHDDMVSFIASNEYYAIVYSPNGEKPKFIRSMEKENGLEYYVERLADNWYSITGNNYGSGE